MCRQRCAGSGVLADIPTPAHHSRTLITCPSCPTPPGCRRYFHTLPFLLLRSPLPKWVAAAVLGGIEVSACLPAPSTGMEH